MLFMAQMAMTATVPEVGGMVADRWGLAAVSHIFAVTGLLATLIVVFMPNTQPEV